LRDAAERRPPGAQSSGWGSGGLLGPPRRDYPADGLALLGGNQGGLVDLILDRHPEINAELAAIPLGREEAGTEVQGRLQGLAVHRPDGHALNLAVLIPHRDRVAVLVENVVALLVPLVHDDGAGAPQDAIQQNALEGQDGEVAVL